MTAGCSSQVWSQSIYTEKVVLRGEATPGTLGRHQRVAQGAHSADVGARPAAGLAGTESGNISTPSPALSALINVYDDGDEALIQL